MLQINTGKLFTRPCEYEHAQRGILYTNVDIGLGRTRALEGPLFGQLSQTTELSKTPRVVLYEFTERIEAQASGRGVLVSHGADPYLQDMAVVFSFVLNCICTTDVDLVRRLTSGERSISSGAAPSRYVRRVFDKEVFCRPDEPDLMVQFLNQLLGLERKTYLSVMRAIRTYVTGLHRIADDLELAYTLMVAAGESLAQEFDGHEPTWSQVGEDKRLPIEQALDGAPEDFAQRIKNTILSIEHTSIARRFQEFVIANVDTAYFSREFESGDHPIGRSELPEALALAYKARSNYVHQLKSLPDSITKGHGFHETAIENRSKMLTLQGLSRLIRHVILTFVSRQPVIDREFYDYGMERAGIAQVRLVPNFWVGRADGDITHAGRDKLEGFLEELAGHFLQPGSTVTDLTDVLHKFAAQVSNMKSDKRLPYLAIHVIYSSYLGPHAVQMSAALIKIVETELSKPSPVSLVVHTLFDQVPEWSEETHSQTLQTYRSRRGAKSGIRFPRLFEAAIALDLAERYRLSDKHDVYKATLNEAADDFPDCLALRTFAATADVSVPVRWREVLLPKLERVDTGVQKSAIRKCRVRRNPRPKLRRR